MSTSETLGIKVGVYEYSRMSIITISDHHSNELEPPSFTLLSLAFYKHYFNLISFGSSKGMRHMRVCLSVAGS